MKKSSSLTCLLLLSGLVLPFSALKADVVVLQSGERIEGKVLSEDASTITFEYKLTPKIKDTKIINKTDIKELTRLTPSQAEMQERGLRNVIPTPDFLTASQYESIIQDQLRTFIAKYPGTPEADEVEKIIATLSEEKEKAARGQMKVEGKWLDATSLKRDAYSIAALRSRLAMKEKAAEKTDTRFVEALREFDKLAVNYPASLQYVQAIPEAIQIMDDYEKALQVRANEHKFVTDQRERGLKMIQGAEAQLTKNSIDQEVANFKATFEAQKKNRTKWKDVYRYDMPSIKDAQDTIMKERQALKSIDLAALQSENELLMAAVRYIADENAVEAEAVLKRVPRSMAVNKTTLPKLDTDLRILQEKLRKQKAEAAVAASTAATSQTGPVMPQSGGNALAEALQKAQQGKTADGTPAPADPNAPPAPAAGTPPTAGGGTTPPKPSTTATPTPKPAAPMPAPVVEETLVDKIIAYAPFIGGGLLIVLVLAMFMGKKKKEE